MRKNAETTIQLMITIIQHLQHGSNNTSLPKKELLIIEMQTRRIHEGNMQVVW